MQCAAVNMCLVVINEPPHFHDCSPKLFVYPINAIHGKAWGFAVWPPTILRCVTLENPHPSSGVHSRPWMAWSILVLVSSGLGDWFSSNGQQINGCILRQFVFERCMYCTYSLSLLFATNSFRIVGHSLILLQTPSKPFGSWHDSSVIRELVSVIGDWVVCVGVGRAVVCGVVWGVVRSVDEVVVRSVVEVEISGGCGISSRDGFGSTGSNGNGCGWGRWGRFMDGLLQQTSGFLWMLLVPQFRCEINK